MFPGSGAEIYYNEAGEVLGWDYPSTDGESFYCGMCGYSHSPRDCEPMEDDE